MAYSLRILIWMSNFYSSRLNTTTVIMLIYTLPLLVLKLKYHLRNRIISESHTVPWLLLKTFFTLKVTWKVSVLGSTSPWDTTLASTMSGLICTNSLRLHWGHFGTWVKTGSKVGCFWANIGPKSIKRIKLWFIIPSLMNDTCRLLHEKIAQRSVLKRKISWTDDERTNETNERSLVHDKSG